MYNKYYKRHIPTKTKTREDINYDIAQDLQNSLDWLKTMVRLSVDFSETLPQINIKSIDKYTFKIEVTNIKCELIAEKTTNWRTQWKWTLNGENFQPTNQYQQEAFLKKHFDKIAQVKYWLYFYDPTAWASDSNSIAMGSDRCLKNAKTLYAEMLKNEKMQVLNLFQQKGVFNP